MQHQGARESPHVLRCKVSEREAFFRTGLVLQPLIRDAAQVVQPLFDVARGHDAKLQPFAQRSIARAAQAGTGTSFEIERVEVDDGLLAQLHERESEVQVPLEIIAADLVEDTIESAPIRELAKLPAQLVAAFGQ